MIKRISANYINCSHQISLNNTKNKFQTFRANSNDAENNMSIGTKLSLGLTIIAAFAIGVLAIKKSFGRKNFSQIKNSSSVINNPSLKVKHTVTSQQTIVNPDGSIERILSNNKKVRINPFKKFTTKKLPNGEEQVVPFRKGHSEQIVEVFDKNGTKILERTRTRKCSEIFNNIVPTIKISASESKTKTTTINTKDFVHNTSKMKEFDIEKYETTSNDGKKLVYNTLSRIYYKSDSNSDIEKEIYHSVKRNYNNLNQIDEINFFLHKDNLQKTKKKKTEKYIFENGNKILETANLTNNETEYTIERNNLNSYICTKKHNYVTTKKNTSIVNLNDIESNFN